MNERMTKERLAEIRYNIVASPVYRVPNEVVVELLAEFDAVMRERDEEVDDKESTLGELDEAQRALILLADQLERHSVPFVPEAEQATAKARRDVERMRRLEARGMQAAHAAFQSAAPGGAGQ